MDRALATLGMLLAPIDADRRSEVVVTDDRWRVDERIDADAVSDAEVIVFGRSAMPSGTSLAVAGRAAFRRELAIATLSFRPPAGFRVRHVHRLGPRRPGTGPLRRRIRRAMLGGAAIELTAAPSEPRVLDRVLAEAHIVGPPSSLRLSSGGAAVVTGRDASGRPVLVRLAPRGDPADPAGSIGALRSLADARVPSVPQLLDHGLTDAISWTVETVLPGHRPERLSDRLTDEAAHLLGRFPMTDGSPTSLADDLSAIARLAPSRSAGVRALSASIPTVDVPAILRHGDLWAGNLLAVHGRLSGVVDWDAWHPRAVPGADLLELVASGQRLRARRPLGAVWGERPWLDPAFTRAHHPYWDALGFRPTTDQLELVGLAWWAAKVAGTLMRLPERGEDGGWLEDIVDPVLDRSGLS